MSRDDRGQITVMTVGFFVFLGLLVVVVVNASAAYLQRQSLNNLADGAALAAADALSQKTFYEQGTVELDPREARQAVAEYVAGDGVRVVRVDADGDAVHVRLERDVDLALAPPGWTSGTTIVSEATSQLRLGD